MAATIVTFLGYTCQVEVNGAIVQPSRSAVEYPATGWNAFFYKNGLLDLNLSGWIGPPHAEQLIYLLAKVDCVLSNGVWTPAGSGPARTSGFSRTARSADIPTSTSASVHWTSSRTAITG